MEQSYHETFVVCLNGEFQVTDNSWLLRTLAGLSALLVCALLPLTAAAGPQNTDGKYASIVIDLNTDEVLHARNADAPRYPASLTKVMTLYMVFDALEAGQLTLDDRMTVSAFAASKPPSKLGLRPGSTISVGDAIGALVTKSANDVAAVIAEHLGGTESRFGALMTVKARSLGMADTRFYNASGLPDARQVTTARDLATMSKALLDNHGAYYAYFETQNFVYNRQTYSNHNRLLGKVAGVDGIKTGFTNASGYNLIASALRNDRRVLAIMLGGSSSKARNDHVSDLLEAAFLSVPSAPPAGKAELRTRMAFRDIAEPDSKAEAWGTFRTAQGDENYGEGEDESDFATELVTAP